MITQQLKFNFIYINLLLLLINNIKYNSYYMQVVYILKQTIDHSNIYNIRESSACARAEIEAREKKIIIKINMMIYIK
jgi:hypothetical protein